MSKESLDLLREGYEAFNHGSWESIVENFAEDFVARERAELPDPQEYQGVEGARQAFFESFRTFEDFRVEPLEYIDGGDWVVVVLLQRGRGALSGAEVAGEVVHLWRLRDGKIAGLFVFTTKDEALAAADDPGWSAS
jgi:ketosteroid isomerase-like protein